MKSCIDLYVVLVEGDNMVRREGVWFRRVFGFLDESGGCGGGEKWLDVGYIFWRKVKRCVDELNVRCGELSF